MSKITIKKLIQEVLSESSEMVLSQTADSLKSSHTPQDFMKSFVGKKLRDLLNAGSFSNLYVMNKYGIGSEFDEQDNMVLLNNLWQSSTGFINNRVIGPIRKQRDDWDQAMYNTPEYKDWNVKRSAAFKAYWNAKRSGDTNAIDVATKTKNDIMSADPTLRDYRKMMDDMETIVKKFHNTPLTLKDVLPSPDDSQQDKENWEAVVNDFNKFKKNTMNEQKLKLFIKSLIKEVSEEKQDNIADLEKLLANPDPSRSKDYGSIENYKKMLRKKIAKLKGGNDEQGMGPEYRVGSHEPAPFGYGDMDETIGQLKHSIGEMFGKINEDGMFSKFNAISLDQFVDQESLNEADMLGANISTLSPDELQAYLQRTAGDEKQPTDKYKMPYVHKSNIEIKDEANRTFDLDKLKASITQRPANILKQNEKITHSGGDSTMYYNIGLPALKGLAVNEKTGEFVVVDTCPGAGACKVYCYAKKGGYVQWKSSSLSQTRQLNFLLNDPAGYKAKLEAEIRASVAKFGKKGTKVVVRWHDAGDFFSPEYLDLAYSVAKDFPNVDFYAYTKMAGVASGSKPSNFKMNFSMGATPEQEKQIDFQTTKHSTVVPKQLFDDLILKDEDGKLVRDENGKMQFKSPEDLDILKKKLADKYKMPKDSVITYDEMMKIPVGTEPKWNVIVKPGDGDDSANRSDVIGTWLLIH